MSDIHNHSYQPNTSSWASIRTSLTEMERRLGDLQDQLDPRSRTPDARGVLRGVPTGEVGGAGVIIAGPAGATAIASTVQAGAPDLGIAGAAASVGFVPPPFGSDPAARQSAEEIVAQARASAREVLAQAEAQVCLVKEQIERLLHVRQTLKGSLQGALAECGSALQRLEREERSPRHPSEQLLHDEPPSMPRPTSLEGTSEVGIPFTPTVQQPSVYEGSVTLRVGPLRDISQVDTLEIALLQVPGAEQVEIKEFAGRDAVAVIKLFQSVPLVDELRRVLPFQFEVADGRVDALTLLAIEDGESDHLNDMTGSSPVGAK
jgi:hypothetical protein